MKQTAGFREGWRGLSAMGKRRAGIFAEGFLSKSLASTSEELTPTLTTSHELTPTLTTSHELTPTPSTPDGLFHTS